MQDPDDDETERVGVVHSATLMEGLIDAIAADVLKANPRVQEMVGATLRHNKHYHRNIYLAPEALMKLKELGNLTNGTLCKSRRAQLVSAGPSTGVQLARPPNSLRIPSRCEFATRFSS